MISNPRLYEINTRVWIKQFGEGTRLSDIPAEYFRDLKKKGIDIVWLMGIWKTSPSLIKDCCFTVDLVSAYNKSLKDWNNSDVIGSPYSIDDYIVNPQLGTQIDLLTLKENINREGMKLFLDFIPNHFSAATHLINSLPELFLPGDEELLKRDSYTFFRSRLSPEKIFAHGRDPLFPPWTDTIQVNYFSEAAREFMTSILFRLAKLADGIRCDMAMLPLNNVFHNTWIGVINRFQYKKPDCEFWLSAIKDVKSAHPSFIFMGEAYWDLEWQLQQLGFNFTYDKRLTDRLAYNDTQGIKAHLTADKDYQLRSVRFLENHDEPRAAAKFGKIKSLAASTAITTIPGMKFFYDGQFEGKKIKLPLQLAREPEERASRTVSSYYDKLLEITKDEIFRKGEWSLIESTPAAQGNMSYENMLTWQWKMGSRRILVIINYSEHTSQCRIRLNLPSGTEDVTLTDLLTGEHYKRSVKELYTPGLFVDLKTYQSHIFSFNTTPDQEIKTSFSAHT